MYRVKDGFLIGVAPSPEAGAPCADCVGAWLKERDVFAERAEISDLTLRRDLIPDLLTEADPHTLYEIARDGSSTRLDCAVFPHPACACARPKYIAPKAWNEKTNFAFSPLYQIKCVRYGTPNGNLWLTSAVGDSPISKVKITAYGVASEREDARFKAVEDWMKRAAVADLPIRVARGSSLASENFQTGGVSVEAMDLSRTATDGLGAGTTRDEAILDALLNLAKNRTLKRFASSMKNPMLVVGSNNWVRQHVPFFLLQHYDLHLLFYPNSTPAWVVGVAALSRTRTDESPTFVFAADKSPADAFRKALNKVLEVCRPTEWRGEGEPEIVREKFGLQSRKTEMEAKHLSKLNMWWTHWIYRCPKISLKDMLHLESYPGKVDVWRDYFKDGQEPLSLMNVNHDALPKDLRYLVRLSGPSEKQASRNVNGIGTWMFSQEHA